MSADEPAGNEIIYQTRQQVIDKLLQQNDTQGCEQELSDASVSTNRSRQKVWTDVQLFIEDNLDEVYEKLTSLEKQIWGKLVVMESNRRTAKAYLRHPTIVIDGSDYEFDGMRIGISRFENVYRTETVYEIFNEILQGMLLKIDPDGNVWAKRICYSPIFLKPLYRNKPNDLFVIDQRPVKVFDIRRFKEVLVHELRQPCPDRRKLEKCCMICLKFSIDHYDLLRTPVYCIIMHLVAMELLNIVLPKDPQDGPELASTSSASFPSESSSSSPGLHPRQASLRTSNRVIAPGSPSSLGSFAKHPNPGTATNLASSPARVSGRAGTSGVFKRIIWKEEEQSRGMAYTQMLRNYNSVSGPSGFSENFSDSSSSRDDNLRTGRAPWRSSSGRRSNRLIPSSETLAQRDIESQHRDYASMVDLRQIAAGNQRDNIGYYNREDETGMVQSIARSNTDLNQVPTHGPQRSQDMSGNYIRHQQRRSSSIMAHKHHQHSELEMEELPPPPNASSPLVTPYPYSMASRVFSMDELATEKKNNVPVCSIPNASFLGQLERMRMTKRWRSQDSGIGSGNGSK